MSPSRPAEPPSLASEMMLRIRPPSHIHMPAMRQAGEGQRTGAELEGHHHEAETHRQREEGAEDQADALGVEELGPRSRRGPCRYRRCARR